MSPVRNKVDNTGRAMMEVPPIPTRSVHPLASTPSARRKAEADVREMFQTKTQVVKLTKAPRPTPPPVSAEDIALRAYEIFESRGGGHGQALDDWLQAEQELFGYKPPPR